MLRLLSFESRGEGVTAWSPGMFRVAERAIEVFCEHLRITCFATKPI